MALGAAGCLSDAIKEDQRQLDQQKAELEQLKQQVAALKNAQQPSYPTTAPPPGSCDKGVMQVATRHGGERFAASEFDKALGYYQDAVTACPMSAQAQLNVARAYEALGDRGPGDELLQERYPVRAVGRRRRRGAGASGAGAAGPEVALSI